MDVKDTIRKLFKLHPNVRRGSKATKDLFRLPDEDMRENLTVPDEFRSGHYVYLNHNIGYHLIPPLVGEQQDSFSFLLCKECFRLASLTKLHRNSVGKGYNYGTLERKLSQFDPPYLTELDLFCRKLFW
jgi:hypothetical protein